MTYTNFAFWTSRSMPPKAPCALSLRPFGKAADGRPPQPVDPAYTAWRDARRRSLSLLPTRQIPSRAGWEAEGVGAALHVPVRLRSYPASHGPLSEGQ